VDTDIFNFSHSGIININFYKVRVLYGAITIDAWSNSATINTAFITNSSAAVSTVKFGGTSADKQQGICASGPPQEGYKVISA
jgi:hypothetical protein